MAATLAAAAPASAERYALESATPAGGTGNGFSVTPAVSHDGSVVAFQSSASDLVPGDGNGACDVFVREGGTTERVSVDSGGGETGGAECAEPALSADGRIVAFASAADDLVPGDTNGHGDVFVHDRATGETRRVNAGPGGVQADGVSRRVALSADGRHVAFESFAPSLHPSRPANGQVYVVDLVTGAVEMVSVAASGLPSAGAHAREASISADGRHVAFVSGAQDLVAGDDNGIVDVFVRDRTAGVTERVSVRSDGSQAVADTIFGSPRGSFDPAISGDGRFVAFGSAVTDLVPGDRDGTHGVFRHDRVSGVTQAISVDWDGAPSGGLSPAISFDGARVAFHAYHQSFPGWATDVFLHDGVAAQPFEISPGREDGDFSSFAALSGDGERVAFGSQLALAGADANGVVDVFSAPATPAPDFKPPTLGLPEDVVVAASAPDGAVVAFTASARDERDPSPVVACDPASGSHFPIGTTRVECTATDAAGNVASGGFDVRVLGASEQIALLREEVLAEPGIGELYRTGLLAHLVVAARTTGQAVTQPVACTSMHAFEAEVARRNGGRLAEATAQRWIADARRIRAVMPCAV